MVDIKRAMDEGADRDARLLARELNQTATNGATLLDAVPDWVVGQAVLTEIGTLLDLDARAGNAYESFLTDAVRADLRRARDLRTEIATRVPAANRQLELLAGMGMSCPAGPLVLESP